MDMKIANRLYSLRKEHNYSQEELADKLGVSRQAVSKWERGEASPDTDNLIALSKLYGVTLDELLFDESHEDEKEVEEVEVEVVEEREEKDDDNDDKDRLRHRLTGLWAMIVPLAYIAVGVFADIWHPTWIIFISVPLFDSLVSAIQKRKVASFAYPILLVIVYLLLGFLISGWHPYWFLFLTIPVYYTIAHEIDSHRKRK